jgi:hypothetical protein
VIIISLNFKTNVQSVVYLITQTIKNVEDAGRGFMSEQILMAKEMKSNAFPNSPKILILVIANPFQKRVLKSIGYAYLGSRDI